MNNNEEKSVYYTDNNIRQEIDKLLKENAKLEASLGQDSTTNEFVEVKIKQNSLFSLIKNLDIDFYNTIIVKEHR